nr:hypothetical protein [Tanacetum cinerariifolium]
MMDEPDLHPAYDFIAPGSLPGYTGRGADGYPSNGHGGDLAMLFSDEYFSDDGPDDDEDHEEVWEVNEEWLMALVTPPLTPFMPLLSTYEVGGPSTAAAEGHSLTLLAHGVLVPPSVIKDLCTRMGNLEYGHGDRQKGDENQPSRSEMIDTGQGIVENTNDKLVQVRLANAVYWVYENCWRVQVKAKVMASHMVQAIGRLEQASTRMEQDQQDTTQRDEMIFRLSQQIQTLPAAVQHRDVKIQQLQTLVSEMSSRKSTLMQCILGMDRRLADLERRPPGPQ